MTNKNSSTSQSNLTASKQNVRNTTEKSGSKKSKSSESDDYESEDSSSPEIMMPYPYAPMYSPWMYAFEGAQQNLTPFEFQQMNGAFIMPNQSSS